LFKLSFVLPPSWTAVTNNKGDDPQPANKFLNKVPELESLIAKGEKENIASITYTQFRQTKLIPSNMISYVVGPLKKRELNCKVAMKKVNIYADAD
jgi:hypothetical protein